MLSKNLIAKIAKSAAIYLNPEPPNAGKKYPKNTPIAADGVIHKGHPAKKERPNGKRLESTTARDTVKPISAIKICIADAVTISVNV